MAILTYTDEVWAHTIRGRACFLCGELLVAEAIMWAGLGEPSSPEGYPNEASSVLALHPSCALDLMVRLMRDVWEYQNSTDGYSAVVSDRAYARRHTRKGSK